MTFLFTDIEGSTRLFQRLGDRFPLLLETHNRLLREAFERYGGVEVRTIGDAFFVAFSDAASALAACVDGQQALGAYEWPTDGQIRVRMGMHTAPAEPSGGDYIALGVHQAARVAAVGHGGQVICSAATTQAADGAVPEGSELRLLGEFHLKDFDTAVAIYQLSQPDLGERFPPLRAPSVGAHNLPRQRTSFVGRSEELADIPRLLDQNSLVTIIGPGGVGKTRVALEVAGEATGRFPDGVWLVELAPISNPELVTSQVALALGVRDEPGRDLADSVADFLASRELLLLIDNCEHLIEKVASFVDHVLACAVGLTVLATSRERLRIEGEQIYRLDSLSLPDRNEIPADALLDFDAPRLFVARAMMADPRFVLTPAAGPAVSAITRQLDGIPLALELAAARVGELPLDELLRGLDDRFLVLNQGLRTAPTRHQTLHALLDWSHDLLSSRAQVLFRRLAVFSGGCTAETVVDICGHHPLDATTVPLALAELTDKSLVSARDGEDRVRYTMLESIRAYALRRLDDSEEESQLRDRHVNWSVAFAKRTAQGLNSADQANCLQQLAEEHANLSTCLDWGLSEPNHNEPAVRLAAALHQYWFVAGHADEGGRRLSQALKVEGGRWPDLRVRLLLGHGQQAHFQQDDPAAEQALNEALKGARALRDDRATADVLEALGFLWANKNHGLASTYYRDGLAVAQRLDDPVRTGEMLRGLGEVELFTGDLRAARNHLSEAVNVLREVGHTYQLARALSELGRVARLQGDLTEASAMSTEALEVSESVQYVWIQGQCRWNLGVVAMHQGDLSTGRRLLEEGLANAQRLDDTIAVAFSLIPLGYIAEATGDTATASDLYEQGLAIARQDGFPQLIADGLNHLGGLALRQGRPDTAATLFEESLGLTRPLGRQTVVATAIIGLGQSTAATGNFDIARAHLRQGLELSLELGDKLDAIDALEAFANMQIATGETRDAAVYLSVAARLRDTIGAPVLPAFRREHEQLRVALQNDLGEPAFGRAWENGQRLRAEQLIEPSLP